MEQHIRLSLRAVSGIRQGGFGPVFRLSSRFPDLLVVPWLLNADTLYTYLAARLLSLCLPFALNTLDRKVTPQLKMLAQAEGQTPFQSAAARINLGYLMICGAMALIVIAGGTRIAPTIGVSHPAWSEVLIWLVIGQSAPAIFGATGLLMRIVDRGVFHDLLLGLTAMLFLIGLATLDIEDVVIIAQTFAAAQLTLAAICALLLTQCGVWPGLTAVFHKEIKIF